MPALLRLAWPIVISMLSASVMTLVDTLMVSTLGAWALAGVGLGGITSFIMICLPIGVLGGIKILASQSVGAGRTEPVKIFLGAGLVLAVGMAACSAAAAWFVADLLPSVSATEASGSAARTYLLIGAFGTLPTLIRVAVEQARLSLNDSQWPMRVNVLANICNVGFNYLFIFVYDMGIAGAAYGTLLSNLIGCISIIGVQALDGYDFRGIERHHLAAVWRLGVPSGFQMALEMGSFTAMVVMLNNLSEIDGAANQIAIQVIHFGFLPCIAFGQAASVMAGQAVGAGRRDLVHVVARVALIPAGIYSALATVTFLLGGGWVASHFTKDPALLSMAQQLLYVAAAFQIADAINIIARSVLQGTGDVRFCALAGIGLAWMMTPPLTWLLAYRAGLGAFGGWLGLCLEIFVTAVIFWMRVRGTRWHAAADRSLQEI
jgi:MATE family multidrug resistance protein